MGDFHFVFHKDIQKRPPGFSGKLDTVAVGRDDAQPRSPIFQIVLGSHMVNLILRDTLNRANRQRKSPYALYRL